MSATITTAANGWIVTTADGVQHIATAEMVVSAATAKASEYEVCQATQGDGGREEVKGEAAAWAAYANNPHRTWAKEKEHLPTTAADFRAALRIAIAANKSEPRRIGYDELQRRNPQRNLKEDTARALREFGHAVEYPKGIWQ